MKRFRIVSAILLAAISSQLSCAAEDDLLHKDMRKMRWNVGRLIHTAPLLVGKDGFPPAVYRDKDGKPTTSWRLMFLQFLNTDPPLMDQPWTSPVNQGFDTQLARGSYSVAIANDKLQPKYTRILALVGPGTAFTEFEAEKSIGLSKLPDDAIVLLECRDKKFHWMEPGDIEIDELTNSKSRTGIGDLVPNYPDGFLVGFADGAVWYISKDVPKEAISKFYTAADASKFDRDKILGPYVIERVPSIMEHEHEELERQKSKHAERD